MTTVLLWLRPSWWRYLLGRRNPDIPWLTVIRCRARGHPCGTIYYSSGYEPDDRCKNCYDHIG